MANVAIRFSVENAETVRQALQQLGKDGEKALQQLHTGTAAPNRGLNALSSLIDDAKGRMMGLATSIGPLGTAMVQLGPAGMATAAAFGLVASAFSSLTERAQQMAEWARKVREAAETAGTSTDELQALARAGDRVGISFENTAQFLTRLTTSVEQLRQGSGPLFTALARIDAQLVREVAAARSTAEALDILRTAYQRLDTQAQRNTLARAIGGGSGVEASRLLGDMGSTAEEIERARNARRLASAESLQAADEQYRALQRTREESAKIFQNMFSGPAMDAQQRAAEIWLSIAQRAERISQALRDARDNPLAQGLWNFIRPPTAPPAPAPGASRQDFGDFSQFLSGDVPSPAPGASAAVNLELMRRWSSVIGDALTPSEQLAQRILELNAAQESGAVNAEQHARGLASFTRQQDAASTATRQRLGIVREEEVLTTRMRELDDLQAKGFIRNADERAAAERMVRREIRETMEALRVRASETPALTRLSIDADNLTKNLDQNLAGALRGTTSTILEMAKGTKTLSQGFGDLAVKIAEAVAEAILLKTVVGPMANALSGMFGGSSTYTANGWTNTVTPSARGNVLSAGRIMPFARGGIFHTPTIFPMANGMGLMGEAGPEAIMPLRRLSSGRLGVEAAGGGGGISIVVNNNAPNTQASAREVTDGRGGRRIEVQIDEMVARALGRQGSVSARILGSRGAMVRL